MNYGVKAQRLNGSMAQWIRIYYKKFYRCAFVPLSLWAIVPFNDLIWIVTAQQR